MSRQRGFTLVEIVIATTIMLIVLMLAIPSLQGVLADKRLRRSLDAFNNLVNQARERSVTEHRPYLITLDGANVDLRPEVFLKNEEPPARPQSPFRNGDAVKMIFPAALTKEQPNEWIFWPSGTCEPAIVQFQGRDGVWSARYSGLTSQPELDKYAVR